MAARLAWNPAGRPMVMSLATGPATAIRRRPRRKYEKPSPRAAMAAAAGVPVAVKEVAAPVKGAIPARAATPAVAATQAAAIPALVAIRATEAAAVTVAGPDTVTAATTAITT